MNTLILLLLSFCTLTVLWSFIWHKFFQPVNQKREIEYLRLYIVIQTRLYTDLSQSEINDIRRMLCLLESMKYKNNEMTEVLTLQWVKRKYGMTKKEMEAVRYPA